jgi:hypothetical protein
MQTVPEVSTPRKSNAFRAHLDDQEGIAVSYQGSYWFLGDDHSKTLLHDSDFPFLQLHGFLQAVDGVVNA